MGRGQISRGDLLRAIIRYEGKFPPEAAKALGFLPLKWKGEEEKKQSASASDNKKSQPDNEQYVFPSELDPVLFWQPISFVRDELISPTVGEGIAFSTPPKRVTPDPAPYPYLTAFNDLVPRLRAALSEHRFSRAYDIPRIVERISSGEPLRHLPRLHRPGWGSCLYVIEDRCDYLAPYVRDQAWLQAHLQGLYSPLGFHEAIYSECYHRPMVVLSNGKMTEVAPRPGDQVLVLGDLGSLAKDGGRAAKFWQELGDEWRDSGASTLALVPCSPSECSEEARRCFKLLSWEHPAPRVLSPEELEERGQHLLTHVSIAPRIEPCLLRAIRLGLGAREFPARLEAWVWQHRGMSESDLVATALETEEAKLRHEIFRQEEDRRNAIRTLGSTREAMIHLPYELWLEPVLNFGVCDRAAFTEQEHEDGVQLLNYLAGRVSAPDGVQLSSRTREWLHGFSERLSDEVRKAPETKNACWELGKFFSQGREILPLSPAQQPVHFNLYHQGDKLHVRLPLKRNDQGSQIAEISSSDGFINVTKIKNMHFWQDSQVPSWARRWGCDDYGPWVEFVCEGVAQRMRWVAPGSFQMGSSADEAGRWEDEGPQHMVRLSEGYWIFDTPVTQALWQAVMEGENPSKFQSSERPVEQVSWDDCRLFLQTVNKKLPGLELSLPTEAQWEYACRAGSSAALYNGPIEILGENNAPSLDGIAWYGGNSGEDFEQRNGSNSSDWKEKQYDHKRAGTHPVGRKLPNAWGLYDMLGNVWEWCLDGQREYSGEEVLDPKGDLEPGALRVIRGGSWSNEARLCRCAYRSWSHPDSRIDSLGFRCARVQVSQSGQGKQGAAAGRPAEPRRAPATENLWLRGGEEDGSLPLPGDVVELELRTDREQLVLQRRSQPPWASAMGRDRFGLWAEFSYNEVVQRMRWIPPGRFLMGSPKDEPGRFDREGPRHYVNLSKGYWLFNTPVTQSLWQVVMGDNPSRFQSPDRPMEQVSWDDCQLFLQKINRKVPGVQLSLPSEAQWEYACRAGSRTALPNGPMEILGEHNAPALDAIAWYGGNSGVDFELENGSNSSDWKEKQYDHKLAGTHSVGQKTANAWGLYDMLGNVWEWCLDGKRDYTVQEVLDPKGDLEPGAERVIRGGSWNNLARRCRCAYRNCSPPDNRNDSLGFRCARVHE